MIIIVIIFKKALLNRGNMAIVIFFIHLINEYSWCPYLGQVQGSDMCREIVSKVWEVTEVDIQQILRIPWPSSNPFFWLPEV